VELLTRLIKEPVKPAVSDEKKADETGAEG
jgi:hypothetical protein